MQTNSKDAMKKINNLLIALLILVVNTFSNSFAEEITSESERTLRNQAFNDVMTSYRECSKSSANYLYWKKVLVCFENAKSEDEKYLCLSQSSDNTSNTLKLKCELVKPTTDDINRRVELLKSKKPE